MAYFLLKLVRNSISHQLVRAPCHSTIHNCNRNITTLLSARDIVASSKCSSVQHLLRNNIRNTNSSYLFHTSRRCNSPKLVILLIRPFIAGISGRIARYWWNRQPKESRNKIIAKLNRHRFKLLYGVAGYFAAVVVYWLCCQEKAPITGRVRFMAFSVDNLRMISDMALEQVAATGSGKILPPDDPRSVRVLRVASRIVAANKTLPHLRDEKITVTVIDEPGQVNAMVTSTCKIVVFADMLNLCKTDDELAMVLSHELAHAVLDHVAEKISSSYLIGFFTAPVIAALWAILPSDFVAYLATLAMNKIVELSVELPYSRFVETEADDVGLEMAAKACYDVRTAVPFWIKLSNVEKDHLGLHPGSNLDDVEYFLTHPTSEKRAEHLNEIMDRAIKTRSENQCPPLREFSAVSGYNVGPPIPIVVLPF